MIILITGALGTGKTALAVKLLTEHKYYPDNAVIVGVREWKGKGHFYTLKSQVEAPANQKLIEEIGTLSGTVYLVDEGKKIWPSRIAGKQAPVFIDTHLAESRSIAQDWIITAQAPGQIDVALRRLVGRHIHLLKTPLGIKYSEAGECRDDLEFSADESRKYEFPAESLALYRSDDEVTDLQKKGLKLPKRLIFLMFLITFLFGVIYYFANQSTMLGFGEKPEAKKEEGGFMQSAAPSSATAQQQQQQNNEILPLSKAPGIYYYAPQNPHYPELAKAPRIPQSCLKSKSQGCVCYDQYQNRIQDFPLKRCEDIVNGLDQIAFTRDKKNI